MPRNNKPMRLQRTRQKGKGYLFPEGEYNDLPIVAVSRPSKWGNKFKVGVKYMGFTPENVEEAVLQYERFITFSEELIGIVKSELKGKNLACWCKLGTPCHADILIKIANQ